MKFYQFIKNPYLPEKYEKISIKTFLKLVGLLYLLSIIPNVITNLLINNDIIPSNHIDSLINEYNPWSLLFTGVIIVPFAEETLFRLNLKTTKFNLSFSSIIVLIYIAFLIYKNNASFSSAWILLIIYMVTTALFYSKYFIKIDSQKHIKIALYFSAIIFGFLHTFNFGNPNYIAFILFPIITMPQIILGFISGYLRLKHGFVYSVAFHMVVNFIGLSFTLLLK